MAYQRLISGIALATCMAIAGAVTTAASDGQDKAKRVEEKRPADEPKGNLDRLQLTKLEELLAQQRQLLDRLDSLEGTTLPNAFHGVHSSLLDVLADVELKVLDAIGGLQLQCSTPDLLPLPAPGTTAPFGFCQFNADNTQLLVRIHNQGGVASPATTTRLTFFGGTVVEQSTPALAAFGGSFDLFFDIPENCYPEAGDSDCSFVIAADVANVSAESNEANNVATGICTRIG